MSTTAYDALRSYVESTSAEADDAALAAARAHAEEYALSAPDEMTGQLLATLAATSSPAERAQAVAITPATAVAGLYLLSGLPENGILTCIDPEAEHQHSAKAAFRSAGYAAGRARILPAHPLDVMDRLATEAYKVIFADVPTLDLVAITKAAWPLLRPGGTLVLANSLLDGTLADPSRNDRATTAAREADDYARGLADAVVARLPLGAGLTLLTKRPAQG